VTGPGTDPAAGPGRSYRPGEWFGILGESVVVVLPPSEKARVSALWELVDAGAGFDEVLDALISSGLRQLPGFVLVSERDGETTVVLRGAATASFITEGETVTLEGSAATTWVERVLSGVRGLRIDVPASSAPEAVEAVETVETASDLPIETGLVRIARIERAPYAVVEGVPDPPAAIEAEPEVEPTIEPALESAEAAPGAESPLDEDAPPTSPQDQPAPPEPTPPAPWGLPAYAPPVEPPTQLGQWDPGEFARGPAGIAGQPPTPPVVASPVAKLTFSSGEVVPVDRPVVIGRAPEARRFSAVDQPRLVTVASPHQEISSTHLEIRPGTGADLGSAVVTDLGSTNGTVLLQPGLSPEDLQPGIAVQLIPGAIIDLGDGVTIQVGNG